MIISLYIYLLSYNLIEMELDPNDEMAYNNLHLIQHLRHEVITDKTLSYHDALFKIIIIGDTGTNTSSLVGDLTLFRHRKILCVEETCRK